MPMDVIPREALMYSPSGQTRHPTDYATIQNSFFSKNKKCIEKLELDVSSASYCFFESSMGLR